MAVTINQGTQTSVNTTTLGGGETQVIRLDIGAGTNTSAFGGTITEVSNLVKGTITKVEGGTIGLVSSVAAGTVTSVTNLVGGTIFKGTVIDIGIRHPNEFATTISSGTSVLGTIKPLVAGSVIYITSLVISVATASNVVIASGGTSTPIGGTYFLNQNGGAALTPLNPPMRTASGSALVYKQSADNGLTIFASGYVE